MIPRFALPILLTSLAVPSGALVCAQMPSAALVSSTRCLACHNNLKTATGKDVSIGTAWSASVMANSARDPYWQSSVRRETLDHPSAAAAIQTECASCHMPQQHFADKSAGHDTAVFAVLPLDAHHEAEAAADGVGCSGCHLAQPEGLGTASSYNGNLVYAPAGQAPTSLYGPYPVTPRAAAIHTAGAKLTTLQSDHLRQAGLCGSCHTLYTNTLDASGKPAGRFPEQMVYLEWLHSDYHEKQTCQQCHMPAVGEPAPVATLGSPPHDDVRRHSFTGANFFLQEMLNAHHEELAVSATPAALTAAAAETRDYLRAKAAHLSVSNAAVTKGHLTFSVVVQNLSGHKLPTAYPSRRAWLHVTVTDPAGKVVFESGKLNDDGSIAGNLNDADPARYSPHYSTITAAEQVQIFEPILGDSQGHVTTALLSATQYLKDNRILPAGFDKQSASPDIAVRGKAAADAGFAAAGATTRYEIPVTAGSGHFRVKAELLYQPVGFRWAHNLEPYKAAEPQQFVSYYKAASRNTAVVLAEASGDY
jgi:hypothetical protein